MLTQISSPDISNYLKTWQPQPVEQATSFPAEMYTSETVYRLEQKQIFGKLWLYVGHIGQLSGTGSYFTTSIAEQPLLIVMDGDRLRGFFNICSHRAGPVAAGQGQCERFTCLYHAWTFDLQGNLKTAPHLGEVADFYAAEHGLRSIQVDTWGPFIFVNLDENCPPLAAQLGEVPEKLKNYNLTNLVQVNSIDYMIDANWKLYVENSAESYHAPMVHPGLGLFRSLGKVEYEVDRNYYLEYIPYSQNERDYQPKPYMQQLDNRETLGTSVLLLWPNMVLVMCSDFVLARIINPQGLAKTHLHFDWFVPNTPKANTPEHIAAVTQLYDRTVKEDIQMLHQIQKAVQSSGYTPGRLSAALEVGVHQFQQTLMRCLLA